jgi:tRNA G46 methylase TrmB
MKTKKRLLRRGGTKKNFHMKLKEIYPSCVYDSGTLDRAKYDNFNITYGEMNYEGIDKLKNHLEKNKKICHHFLDIGSGRGKLCFYMSHDKKYKQIVGIEVVKERHDDAIKYKDNLKSKYSDRVILLNEDIMKINLQKLFPSAVFVWWSNLCFHEQDNNNVFNKLLKELPEKSVVCCSKSPSGNIREADEKLSIPMSWSVDSNILIYYL